MAHHEGFQSVRLPAAVWESPDTENALRDRRVSQLFVLAKKYAGASQARIAAATGLNQSEVSRIQRGDRQVTAIDVLERIAAGFAMPDSARVMVGLAPREWSGAGKPGRASSDPATAPGAVADTGSAADHRPGVAGTAVAGTGPDGARRASADAEWSAVVPAQLPPSVAGFVGRLGELTRLDERRRGGITIVVGDGGIGKSALVLAWAHTVTAEFPDGQLYVDLRCSTDRPVDVSRALAAFLRALDHVSAPMPPTVDERTARYRSLLSGRRVLVVIDDVNDEAQVRALLPGTARCAVVVTSRRRLDGLAIREGATVLPLSPLSRGEAVQMLVRAAGTERAEADPATVAEMVDHCGGQPLLLRTVVLRLVDEPDRPLRELAGNPAGERPAVAPALPAREAPSPRRPFRSRRWPLSVPVAGVPLALSILVASVLAASVAAVVGHLSLGSMTTTGAGRFDLLLVLLLSAVAALLVPVARTAGRTPAVRPVGLITAVMSVLALAAVSTVMSVAGRTGSSARQAVVETLVPVGSGQVMVTVTPMGHRRFTLQMSPVAGAASVGDVREVRADATLPGRAADQLVVPFVAGGDDRWSAPSVHLPRAGQWVLTLHIRTADAADRTGQTRVAVR